MLWIGTCCHCITSFRNRGIFRCFFHQLPTAKIFLGDPGQLNGGVLSHGGYPVPMKSQSRRWSRLETYGDWESLIFFWKSPKWERLLSYCCCIHLTTMGPTWWYHKLVGADWNMAGLWLYIYCIYIHIYIYIGNNHIFQLTFRIFGLWLSIQ